MDNQIKTNQNEQPLMVTIQCITYNHEPYIRQCLDGFVMQKTNFRFEAIVHDDASTDGTAAIIREYAEKYPDIIKPIYETENQYSKHDGSLQGIMDEHTHGKYVALCEGDDYWTDPLKLQKQVDFLERNPEYGLVYTNVDFYFQKRNLFKRKYITSGELDRSYDFVSHLVNGGYIAPCTWVYRREFIPTYKKKYVDGTFPLALDIWANSKIYFFDEVTTVYRVVNESASHSRSQSKRYRFAKGVFEIQCDFAEKYNVDELIKEIIKTTFVQRNFPYILLNEPQNVIKEYRQVLKNEGSLSIKNRIALFLSYTSIGIFLLRIVYRLRDL